MLHQVKEALRVKMANNEYITLVHEATNEDPWGPTGQQMDEVAKVFHNGHDEIMEELVLRLKHRNHSWRSCYKSLLVIDHLARNVHDSMIPVISVLVPTLKQISHSFTCNEKGVDRGLSVRERSRKLVELLTDGEMLRDERQKAEMTRKKVAGEPIGMGASAATHGARSRPSASSGAYDAYDGSSSKPRHGNPALREEQERADMILAMKLQNEEERRAAGLGSSVPYLHDEPVVRTGRVKGAPQQQQQRPHLSTAGLSQEEIDLQIAKELQRRVDNGEPLTPSLFQHDALVAASSSPPQTQTNKQAPHAAAPAQTPASDIDSLFDFGTPTVATTGAPPQSKPAPARSEESFDPFAPPPATSAPPPPAAQTDFFDSFAQKTSSNQQHAPITAQQQQHSSRPQGGGSNNVHEGLDLFSSASQQQQPSEAKASDATAPSASDAAFEQQMRGLQGLSTNGNQNRPTLDEVVGRKPLW